MIVCLVRKGVPAEDENEHLAQWIRAVTREEVLLGDMMRLFPLTATTVLSTEGILAQ